MPISVSNVAILGPCAAFLDGAVYYSDSDLKGKLMKTTKERDSKGGFGSKFDKTLLDCMVEWDFTPAMWKDFAKMFAILGKAPGARVFGNTDKPLVVWSLSEGKKYTFSRAAIVEPPKLGLGVEKDLLGSMKIRCLRADATALSGANSIVALTTGQTFADTSFDPTKLFDVPYAVTYGDGSILGTADTEDGVDVDWDIALKEIKSDQGGIYDYRVTGLGAKATLKPFGITEANLLALAKIQGTGVRRGAKMRTFAADLVIAGLQAGDPSVTIYSAFVGNSGMQGSLENNTADAFEFETVRTITTGALGPLAAIGVVA